VPQGAGLAPKRVTEGKQGKYGRDGALWKHPAEGRLYKDAVASRQQRYLCARWPLGPALKQAKGEPQPNVPPHFFARLHAKNPFWGDGVEGEMRGCNTEVARA
jgi:4'-phosphopantetheinyl transferase EntD